MRTSKVFVLYRIQQVICFRAGKKHCRSSFLNVGHVTHGTQHYGHDLVLSSRISVQICTVRSKNNISTWFVQLEWYPSLHEQVPHSPLGNKWGDFFVRLVNLLPFSQSGSNIRIIILSIRHTVTTTLLSTAYSFKFCIIPLWHCITRS